MNTRFSRALVLLAATSILTSLAAVDVRLAAADSHSADAKAASASAAAKDGNSSHEDPDAAEAADEEAKKYALRYKFEQGEKIRWKVIHRSKVRTTVSGSTQTAETVSISTKQWRVTSVKSDDSAVFVHLVENIDMRQKLTGRDEVRYRSADGEEPPMGFENVAKAVGRPLSVVTLDPQGKVLDRQRRSVPAAVAGQGQITIPLPEEPVAVGDVWSEPHDIEVPLPTGTVKKVKARQNFVLEEVKTGVAKIRVATQILTPIHDPAIEAQLIQRESTGHVKFDIAAGRIVGQRMEVDKRVIGFRGEASSLHYLTRFTEELLDEPPQVAAKAEASGDSTVQ
jgi:hypothetical protein